MTRIIRQNAVAAAGVLVLCAMAGVAPGQVGPVPVNAPDEVARTFPPPAPPPESGSNTVFSFHRSATYPEMYEVLPHGESEATLVSGNFLGLVARDPVISDEQKLVVVTSYPDMVLAQYNLAMNENYPDASVAYAQPFDRMSVAAADSAAGRATVAQDPLLSAYVRVQMTDTNGQPQEFSLSRFGLGQMLKNPRLKEDPDSLLMALQTYPFRLPEEARARFNSLTKAEVFEMADRMPMMARQELVKSRSAFLKDAETAGKTNALAKPSWFPAAKARADAEARGLPAYGPVAATAPRAPSAAGVRAVRPPAPASPLPESPLPDRAPRRFFWAAVVVGVLVGGLGGYLLGRGARR